MLFTTVFDFVVPIDSTKGIKMLYVFVDIKLDATHFVDIVRHNFEPGASLAIVSTIQFVATIQVCELLFSLCLLSYWVSHCLHKLFILGPIDQFKLTTESVSDPSSDGRVKPRD